MISRALNYPAVLLAVKGLASGVLGFLLDELITGQGLLGGLIGLFSGMLIAYVARKPAMLQLKQDQRRERQHDADAHVVAVTTAFEKQLAAQTLRHEEDTRHYRRIIADYKLEARKNEIMRDLARGSRHNAVRELDAAYAFIRLMQVHCEANNKPFGREYKFKVNADFCEHEDSEINRMLVSAVDRIIGNTSGENTLT